MSNQDLLDKLKHKGQALSVQDLVDLGLYTTINMVYHAMRENKPHPNFFKMGKSYAFLNGDVAKYIIEYHTPLEQKKIVVSPKYKACEHSVPCKKDAMWKTLYMGTTKFYCSDHAARSWQYQDPITKERGKQPWPFDVFY